MDDELDLDLITLREALQKKHGRRGPSYNQLWRAAANGFFPARRIRRHWHVRVADIPLVEAYYELTAPATSHAA
jgi:hypothetical protein